MFKFKTIVAIALMASLTAGVSMAGLVANGDFEAGLNDWFQVGVTVGADNGPSAAGTQCAFFEFGGNRTDLRSWAISVDAGTEYTLTFDYKTSAGSSDNPQLRFRFFESADEHGNTSGAFKGEGWAALSLTNGNWEVKTVTYTAPEGATAADILLTANVFGTFGGQLSADNMTVVPEPVSLLMLGMGGLMILRKRSV